MNKELLLTAIGIFFTLAAQAQDKNIPLKGRIVADSLDGSAVHIINTTQQTGTVNSSTGTFVIDVKENDTLLFSSVQFVKEEHIISKVDLQKGFLEIKLTEDVNELAAVNLSDTKLTGNLQTDISNIEIVKDLPFAIDFSAIKNKRFKADINDPLAKPDHLAMRQNEISTGAGSVNILGGLSLLADVIGIKSKSRKPAFRVPSKPASKQVRELFDNDFFISSLGIKEERIDDFIFYLEDVKIDSELLEKKNQLALIDFLFTESEKYKALRSGN